MKAIILAGGKGTRLYPVTLEIPKPLLTVNRKPIINYLVELFSRNQVKEIKIIVRPQDREEFDWWRLRWQAKFSGVAVSFEEEPEPMGTLGYLLHYLRDWIGQEPFFMTNGDELKETNLGEMMSEHERGRGLATIALIQVAKPQEYGVAVLNGQKIVSFLEKPESPPSNLVNSGLYLIEPEAFVYLKREFESGEKFLAIEKTLFPKLAEAGRLIGYRSTGRWFDCGNLERWEKAIKEWK